MIMFVMVMPGMILVRAHLISLHAKRESHCLSSIELTAPLPFRVSTFTFATELEHLPSLPFSTVESIDLIVVNGQTQIPNTILGQMTARGSVYGAYIKGG